MARSQKSSRTAEPLGDFTENIVDIDVTSEMEGSFLEYAYSVIYSRALPDARDGLKPVQRRILYMMSDMGLRPDRGHVKSARVVGEVMGKLHPHGDTAIYDAMVRMAQDFSLRLPLIDGHGNFGSLDDGPAAPRYTEARLAAAALTMTDHLDEDVVDFVPNYDNQLTQPDVLPAAFPNLLVNGTTGIAVGMATNMPPHNLVEVIAAARHLIANPGATLDEIMRFIPGPDLPTGGRIVGLDGIRDAYATGRGSFKTRAKVEVEQLSARRTGLVVTELPYMVGPEKVIEKIKDAVNAKKLTGISDVVDLTDRNHGLRLVIELKNGFNPNAVLQQLYRYSPMEDSFGINNVTLVDGQPQTLGLLQLLQVYVEHRLNVVRRRTSFRLGKKKDRLHLVEGLLIAIVDIDEVIQIIRSSDEASAARERLMSIYDLTEIQANYILELRLRQLTKYSRLELEKEQDELRREIEALEAILASDVLLRDLVSGELAVVAEKYGTPRRTVLLESEAVSPTVAAALAASVPGPKGKAAALPLEIPDDPCWALLSVSGQIARTSNQEPLAESGPRTKHDVFRSVVKTTARGEIGAVTSQGRMLRLQVMDMPVLPPVSGLPNLAGGVPAKDFITLLKGETLVAFVPLDAVLAIGTVQGVVKRVQPDYPLNREDWEIIALKDKDSVLAVEPAQEDNVDLVFVTRQAQLLRFSASNVRPQGRTAGGMAGIKLGAGDEVIHFGTVRADDPAAVVVTIAGTNGALPGTAPGTAKVTAFEEYPAKGRATGGVRVHRFLKGEDTLLLAWAGHGPAKASSAAGVARALPHEHGRRDGSGVPLSQPVEAIGPSMAWAEAAE
ncbi:DNA topoisomerase (ATP-hydrolyzing) subunit A [Paenarthrobacter aurescens]|uniref:DNA topoisomerase (ATP-hydrolyzing) n=1 Tax=Paenarthrobacter aurescens TaxID=43663 RepID=A0A4Y3NG16_PAEAU|nr:DNA topoisomerase IV subunit A [Paenarthrobacter aurescens]MDO6143283.1 DNA topoisomerase IV subunit A [Paenarthrobacter aurescens]MDO6147131.1 DNA topoisomerase IV subunit A [Paenarthrobacter aurescens]MDO6158375.1 DNA topoisomerase IV subunit A [Paenarthrobacter aurescens]MDO6162359.1 DNA topoisomerase IV subunit A [Paenarthrobacter aurescens]GEB18096.1 DNA topoisomerase (ATP-hydrolyzing) [Paenarthrobacter aurescens]